MNLTQTLNEAARELACFEGNDINLDNAKIQLEKITEIYATESAKEDIKSNFTYFAQIVLSKTPYFKS